MQSSLKAAAIFHGVGLHGGQAVCMIVRPAAADTGIRFRRSDVTGDQMIPARWDAVVASKLCTLIENSSGVQVSTVEHIMAALAGCGIHNAIIDIDGPEVPILDGSSRSFVDRFLQIGIKTLDAPVRAIRVLKAVEVSEGAAIARLDPADMLEIDFKIDFSERAIGRQAKSLNMSNGAFVRELCDSRTFCLKADVDYMQAHGLALGGTLENAVVFEQGHVLSPGGLRHQDEPVRHKMLDALGDLSLAGGPLLARYTGIRAGHALTNRLLRALFAQKDAWEWVECGAHFGKKLPGAGIKRQDLQFLS